MDKELTLIINENLSHELCNTIIKRFERDMRKKPGQTLSGFSDVKRSTDLSLCVYNDWKDIDTILYSKLADGLKQYFEHCETVLKDINVNSFYKTVGFKDTGYQIQRYRRGEYYKWHDDSSPHQTRYLAYIWYLNTLEEEDGGCTSFTHGLKVRPETGKLLIFPSTWTNIHRSDEILTRNSKYIITGFIVHRREDRSGE